MQMYCLLCHQKITRWRRLKTHSQFCCDEHAEQHKRETMGRLLEYGPPAADVPAQPHEDDDPIHRLAAVTGHYQVQPENSSTMEMAPFAEVHMRRYSAPRHLLRPDLPGQEILKPRVRLGPKLQPLEMWNWAAPPPVAPRPVAVAAPTPRAKPPAAVPVPAPRPTELTPAFLVELPPLEWDGHALASPAAHLLQSASHALEDVVSSLLPRPVARTVHPATAFWEALSEVRGPAGPAAPLPAPVTVRPASPEPSRGPASRAVAGPPIRCEGLSGVRPSRSLPASPTGVVAGAGHPIGSGAGLQSVTPAVYLVPAAAYESVSPVRLKRETPSFQGPKFAPRLETASALPREQPASLWPHRLDGALLWLPVAPAAKNLWRPAPVQPPAAPAQLVPHRYKPTPELLVGARSVVLSEREAPPAAALTPEARDLRPPSAAPSVSAAGLAPYLYKPVLEHLADARNVPPSPRDVPSAAAPALTTLPWRRGEVAPARALLPPAGLRNELGVAPWSSATLLAARTSERGAAPLRPALTIVRSLPDESFRPPARFQPGSGSGPAMPGTATSATECRPLWPAPHGAAAPAPRRPELTALAPLTAVQLPVRRDQPGGRAARASRLAGPVETLAAPAEHGAAQLQSGCGPLPTALVLATALPRPAARLPRGRITQLAPPVIPLPERGERIAAALPAAGGVRWSDHTAPRRLDEDRLRRFVPVPITKPAARPSEAALAENAPPAAPEPEPGATPAVNLSVHDTTSAFGLRPRPAPLPPRPLSALLAPSAPAAEPAPPPEPVERIDIATAPPQASLAMGYPAVVPAPPRDLPADTLRAALDEAQRKRSSTSELLERISRFGQEVLVPALSTRGGRLTLIALGLLATLLLGGRLLARPLHAGLRSLTSPLAERSYFNFEEEFATRLGSWTDPSVLTRQDDGLVQVKEGLALYRPSLARSDYQLQFEGSISRGAMGWLVRAADDRHFYAFKLGWRGRGRDRHSVLLRTAVVNGSLPPADKFDAVALPSDLKENTMYHLEVSVAGNHITTLLDGRGVDSFSDARLKSGGVGFFAEKGETALVHSLSVSGNDDSTGRTIAWVSGFLQFLGSKAFGS
jgi:hypothetical protein